MLFSAQKSDLFCASERTPHRLLPGELPRRERRHISRVSSQEEIAHAFHCWVGNVKKSERTYWSLVIVCDSQFPIARYVGAFYSRICRTFTWFMFVNCVCGMCVILDDQLTNIAFTLSRFHPR